MVGQHEKYRASVRIGAVVRFHQRMTKAEDAQENAANGPGRSVTISRARNIGPLAGGTRSRVPPSGGAMLTLLRVPI